jgi:hypothetical protein
MGRFIKGILGGFSGKVGNIIGGNWKGISYMRSLAEPSKKPPTEQQLMQRARFAYAVHFLQPLHPVIKIGYRSQSVRKAPMNAALSQTLRQVVEGDYPAYRINYPALMVAKGTLPVPQSHQVQVVDDDLEFTWTDTQENMNSQGQNYALLLAIGDGVYPVYSMNEFRRINEGGVLPLPNGQSGSEVHCYLAFASEDDLSVSNSRYVGSVTLP